MSVCLQQFLTVIVLSCKQTCPKLRDLAESLEGAQSKLFSYQDSLYERINKLGYHVFMPLFAPMASVTRVHFSMRRARATSCTHVQ